MHCILQSIIFYNFIAAFTKKKILFLDGDDSKSSHLTRNNLSAVTVVFQVSQHAAKCIPAMVCPEVTEQIRREIAASLHQRKGDFACYFLTDLVTFTLPAGSCEILLAAGWLFFLAV